MASMTHAASSSGLLWEGAPVAAASIIGLDLDELYRTAIQSVLESGNASLYDLLSGNAEWAPYADKVRLTWNGSEFDYTFITSDEAEVSAMEALEYGDRGTPPNPLLRHHMVRLEGEVTEQEVDLG